MITIIDERNNGLKPFHTLKTGQLFLHDNVLYMKLERKWEDDRNSCRIKNGNCVFIEDSLYVVPVEGKLTIE